MVMQQFGSLLSITGQPNTLDIMQLQYNIDNSRYQSIIHQIRFARIRMLSCLPWSCCWSGSITSSGTSSLTSTSFSDVSIPNERSRTVSMHAMQIQNDENTQRAEQTRHTQQVKVDHTRADENWDD